MLARGADLMKDNIYTIPLTDAFNSGEECPFCFIHKKLEDDAIEFMLGSAYMSDNIREETNKLGFCGSHYSLLYHHGNRLGLALMIHTHLGKLKGDLEPLLKDNNPKSLSGKPNILSKLMGSKTSCDKENLSNDISSFLYKNEANCYICNNIENNMDRYLDTLFFIWKKDSKFVDLVGACKGFCLSHFAALLDLAPSKLSGETLQDFYNLVIPLTLENLNRIEEEIEWFIDKFDYRNKTASWKNSKDAVPRAIEKMGSTYVGDSNSSGK